MLSNNDIVLFFQNKGYTVRCEDIWREHGHIFAKGICPRGRFHSRLKYNNIDNGQGCGCNRGTIGEELVRSFLEHLTNESWPQAYYSDIPELERLTLDCYNKNRRMAVEYSPEYTHSSPQQVDRDSRKLYLCKLHGIQLYIISHTRASVKPRHIPLFLWEQSVKACETLGVPMVNTIRPNLEDVHLYVSKRKCEDIESRKSCMLDKAQQQLCSVDLSEFSGKANDPVYLTYHGERKRTSYLNWISQGHWPWTIHTKAFSDAIRKGVGGFDDSVETQICDLYKSGWSTGKIANCYGVKDTHILSVCRRHDVPMRHGADAYGNGMFMATNIQTGEQTTWSSQRACARVLGVSYKNLCTCLHGKRRTCGGYRFAYVLPDQPSANSFPHPTSEASNKSGNPSQTHP